MKNLADISVAANKFNNLINTEYYIVLGRKGKQLDLTIKFETSHFFHLCGLHKLTDIEVFGVLNTDKVFLNILNGKMKNNIIESSTYYEGIIDRIEMIEKLEDFFDSNKTVFKFNSHINTFSLINADYILKNSDKDKNMYVFVSEDNSTPRTYFCRSAFPRDRSLSDYAAGHTSYTLLYKEKTNTLTNQKQVLYCHPSYQREQSSKSNPPVTNIQKISFENPAAKSITVDSTGTAAISVNFFDKLRDSLGDLLNRVRTAFFKKNNQDEPEEVIQNEIQNEEPINEEPTENNTEKEEITTVPESPKPDVGEKTYDFPVSKELAALFEAREKRADGALSQDEYNKILVEYFRTLHGEVMWRQAAEIFTKQLSDCPERIKRIIMLDLISVNGNIKRMFPLAPQRFQSMAEIKEHAKQLCAEYSNTRRVSEEKSADNDRSEHNNYTR